MSKGALWNTRIQFSLRKDGDVEGSVVEHEDPVLADPAPEAGLHVDVAPAPVPALGGLRGLAVVLPDLGRGSVAPRDTDQLGHVEFGAGLAAGRDEGGLGVDGDDVTS
jgi:hypothetical protein